MIIELRQKSQVTIPTKCTKELDLKIGDKFEILVKDGIIMLIPVKVYPVKYVESLETELSTLKKDLQEGNTPVFHDLDDMFKSLDEDDK